MGVPREHLLDFLAIVAEEMESADLLPPNKLVLSMSYSAVCTEHTASLAGHK